MLPGASRSRLPQIGCMALNCSGMQRCNALYEKTRHADGCPVPPTMRGTSGAAYCSGMTAPKMQIRSTCLPMSVIGLNPVPLPRCNCHMTSYMDLKEGFEGAL
jgi:hypothetical protein